MDYLSLLKGIENISYDDISRQRINFVFMKAVYFFANTYKSLYYFFYNVIIDKI